MRPDLGGGPAWDLWLDFHWRNADGLTHGNIRIDGPEGSGGLDL